MTASCSTGLGVCSLEPEVLPLLMHTSCQAAQHSPELLLVFAGEQASREYDWSKANIDPSSHRFGLVDTKGQQSSVKQVGCKLYLAPVHRPACFMYCLHCEVLQLHACAGPMA